MALTLYDPRTKEFRAFSTPNEVSLPLTEMLLLNILIELHTLTDYLANQTPGSDDPSNIRTDIVSVNT